MFAPGFKCWKQCPMSVRSNQILLTYLLEHIGNPIIWYNLCLQPIFVLGELPPFIPSMFSWVGRFDWHPVSIDVQKTNVSGIGILDKGHKSLAETFSRRCFLSIQSLARFRFGFDVIVERLHITRAEAKGVGE
jgi:hypothetical protein